METKSTECPATWSKPPRRSQRMSFAISEAAKAIAEHVNRKQGTGATHAHTCIVLAMYLQINGLLAPNWYFSSSPSIYHSASTLPPLPAHRLISTRSTFQTSGSSTPGLWHSQGPTDRTVFCEQEPCCNWRQIDIVKTVASLVRIRCPACDLPCPEISCEASFNDLPAGSRFVDEGGWENSTRCWEGLRSCIVTSLVLEAKRCQIAVEKG